MSYALGRLPILESEKTVRNHAKIQGKERPNAPIEREVVMDRASD